MTFRRQLQFKSVKNANKKGDLNLNRYQAVKVLLKNQCYGLSLQDVRAPADLSELLTLMSAFPAWVGVITVFPATSVGGYELKEMALLLCELKLIEKNILILTRLLQLRHQKAA